MHVQEDQLQVSARMVEITGAGESAALTTLEKWEFAGTPEELPAKLFELPNQAVAEVDSSTISYIETHGTGTPLGDPIEVEALRQAFELSDADRSGPCVLGSVKSNIGHLDAASGVAGLVKTILCLKNKAIPPTVHYTAPNPELHLDTTPFVIADSYLPWESDGPRRAGVSSFGVGGTNAHVIVEEAPEPAPVAPLPHTPQVLLLSARTPESVRDARAALAAARPAPL